MITWSTDQATKLRTYLGMEKAARYPVVGGVDPLQEVFEVEATAQANRCRFPADPDDIPLPLYEAIYRRVARNLEMRRFPTGLDTVAADGAIAVVRQGNTDPEIRRLEGPYKKMVFG